MDEYSIGIPSFLLLFDGVVSVAAAVVPLVVWCAHERIALRVVACATLWVQARAFHKPWRDAECVAQSRVLLRLRFRHRVRFANTATSSSSHSLNRP